MGCVTSTPVHEPKAGVLDLEARVEHWLAKNRKRHLRSTRHEISWKHVKFTVESVPDETFDLVEKAPPVSRQLTTVKCSSVEGNGPQTHSCKISRDLTATRNVTFTSSVRLSSDLQSTDTQLPLQVPEAVGHLGVQTMPVSYVGGFQQLNVKNSLEFSSNFSVPPGQTRRLRTKVCEQSREYNFTQCTRITGHVKVDFYRGSTWISAKNIGIAELFRRTRDFMELAEFELEPDYVDFLLEGHVTFQMNTVVDVATVNASDTEEEEEREQEEEVARLPSLPTAPHYEHDEDEVSQLAAWAN